MPLEHAILGFLADEPLTGYDLKIAFDSSVQNFWHANQSEIYRSLKKMEHDGWVTQEVVPQGDRPPRKLYRLTDEGMTELVGWLAIPARVRRMRMEWLVKVFFAHHLPDDDIRGVFRTRAKDLQRRLESLRTEAQAMVDLQHQRLNSDRARALWQITLDHGIAATEWELGWIENALKELDTIPPD